MTSRVEKWRSLNEPWDVIVIGGGITGAGILRKAASLGLKCLLLEKRDFSWGTSSRSGKLVHGGLRYLKQGQIKTTYQSVSEREKLLRECEGLVDPLGILIPFYDDDRLGSFVLQAGLTVYDMIAMRRNHRKYDSANVSMLAPGLRQTGLSNGLQYYDARTDDSRLVLRVLREAEHQGGVAINYAAVENLTKDQGGEVNGVVVKDVVTGQVSEVNGKVIVNATGVWVDQLRKQVGESPKMRPLRGSHLIFPHWRFPLSQAVSFAHKKDGRYIYAFPWEGVTLVGTTDIDHHQSLDEEPGISVEEGKYLFESLDEMFPAYNLKPEDVISTFAGIRPVVDTGKEDPSKESRDHCVWTEHGLLTVTGGKLTTFDILAKEAINKVLKVVTPSSTLASNDLSTDESKDVDVKCNLNDTISRRLSGRYGHEWSTFADELDQSGCELILDSNTIWAELRWAAKYESIVHLDDLLLRRVRLGMILPEGAISILERLKVEVQSLLDWDDERWDDEVARYKKLWKQGYSPDLLREVK
ncbi:glycerol-3-phosphate dehydrogenase/oxidase [Bacillus sp. SM2101]|uniref:glycerol-3-phosphate dehydrogenase/oxidase n=1 Tax=Bacillus sp. SM2101 TaxID=2805366 RepID=UPI001BDF1A31|nr:glycerol-3-phosphate dehydrogenase/oxidase [Bacillus sp. SM2101]